MNSNWYANETEQIKFLPESSQPSVRILKWDMLFSIDWWVKLSVVEKHIPGNTFKTSGSPSHLCKWIRTHLILTSYAIHKTVLTYIQTLFNYIAFTYISRKEKLLNNIYSFKIMKQHIITHMALSCAYLFILCFVYSWHCLLWQTWNSIYYLYTYTYIFKMKPRAFSHPPHKK